MLPSLKERLQGALTEAMGSRDKTAIAVLRTALAAIGNSEAVAAPDSSQAIEVSPTGLAAADVPRRVLTEADIEAIVRTEVTEREAAADSYDASGQTTRARGLRAEAHILAGFLGS